MNIREATRADNDALCALERRTPLNIGDTPYYIDRTNFFETHELQERTVIMLAEEDGQIVGVCAGALHRASLAGKDRLLLYIHHERIAPEHQRRGIGGALTRAISEYWKDHESEHIDSSYWYIAAGNQQSRNFAERGGNKPWPAPAYICMLEPVADNAEKPRRIGAGPIYDIVRLINGAHAGEELFKPYEQVDLGRRLGRTAAYGWGDVYGRFSGDKLVAVAGLWNHTIADYGFEPGAEAEMAALIRSLLPIASSTGQELFVPLDPRSLLYRTLESMPHSLLELLFYAPRVQPPQDGRPIYLDPAYF